jgi:hypothetical protein
MALNGPDRAHDIGVGLGEQAHVELRDVPGHDVIVDPVVEDLDVLRIVRLRREFEVETPEQFFAELRIGLRRRSRNGRPVGAGLGRRARRASQDEARGCERVAGVGIENPGLGKAVIVLPLECSRVRPEMPSGLRSAPPATRNSCRRRTSVPTLAERIIVVHVLHLHVAERVRASRSSVVASQEGRVSEAVDEAVALEIDGRPVAGAVSNRTTAALPG